MSVQVGDLGFAEELGNYAEYSGAPNEEEVLQYARVVIDVRTLLAMSELHYNEKNGMNNICTQNNFRMCLSICKLCFDFTFVPKIIVP